MIGTLVGLVVGFLFTRNINGALLGAALGFIFWDRTRRTPTRLSPEELQSYQALFFKTVFTLLGHIAKADGHISENEIKLTQEYMDKMGLTPDHKREAIRLFKEGASAQFDLRECLAEFSELGKRSPNLSQMLLVYLTNLAMVDGELDSREVAILQQVAASLGFSRAAFEQLLNMIGAQNSFAQEKQGNDLSLAYTALGVSPEASDADIKKAYRKLMSQYHPDKLMGQGLPEDMIKSATERSQEIQAAYDLIKKARA